MIKSFRILIRAFAEPHRVSLPADYLTHGAAEGSNPVAKFHKRYRPTQ
jgi:hypothetical protein